MNTHFETWGECDAPYSAETTKELCRIAWENGAYCALNPEPVVVDFGVVDDDDFGGRLSRRENQQRAEDRESAEAADARAGGELDHN